MRVKRLFISLFVVVWLSVFCYETFRYNYLGPLLGRRLPKVPLLFPPAGWIMFYRIEPSYGFAEVYGLRGNKTERISPYDIFSTRTIGFDNFHRNILVGVLYKERLAPFCRYLHWKLPQFDGFAVEYSQYPDVVGAPSRIVRSLVYRCQR